MAKQGDIIQSMFASINKSVDEFRAETKSELKDIQGHIASIDIIQAQQKGILEEHIRRTEASEERLEKIEGRIKPIEAHVSMWAGAGKLLVVLGVIAGIAGAIIKLVLK